MQETATLCSLFDRQPKHRDALGYGPNDACLCHIEGGDEMRTKEGINPLEVTNRAGEKRTWRYHWDKTLKKWILRTESGLEIELGKNWVASKPIVSLVLSNHGLRAKL